ncbi:MAG: hypothetical protein CVU60_00870 [Deltaproteobacteria bacterium HGW-Deltaproteobacteria-18]|jgi:hypothetical protein|nr:MAG: hypothetical protein CVU60_00870 [Deltaproteobacteria bacterium HGW-Deltaproteobacteria-18]
MLCRQLAPIIFNINVEKWLVFLESYAHYRQVCRQGAKQQATKNKKQHHGRIMEGAKRESTVTAMAMQSCRMGPPEFHPAGSKRASEPCMRKWMRLF